MGLVATHGLSGALEQRELPGLDHASVQHELNRPAVGLQLVMRFGPAMVEVPQNMVGAFVEVDEDLFRLRQARVAASVPEDDRVPVPLDRLPRIGHRVVDDARDRPIVPIPARGDRDLRLQTRCHGEDWQEREQESRDQRGASVIIHSRTHAPSCSPSCLRGLSPTPLASAAESE